MPIEIPDDIRERAAGVRLVAFDVDGTLTDGRLWYNEEGAVMKAFHTQDGLGLKRLHSHGVEVALITARVSHAVSLRAEELDIMHVYQGQDDKRACLDNLLKALHLSPRAAAFVGDDLTDLAAMRLAGLSIAVANAHPWVSERAHWRTQTRGGEGAGREVCDLILSAQDKANKELEYWL